MAKMRSCRRRPLFAGDVRDDGRHVHPMYLSSSRPQPSRSEWDYYTLLATIPAEQAFRPLEEGKCPLVTQ